MRINLSMIGGMSGFLGLALIFTACATSGGIKETLKLTTSLHSFERLRIEMEKGKGSKESEYREQFANMLKEKLLEGKVFKEVYTEKSKADLIMKIHFTQIDEPSSLSASLMSASANSEVRLRADLIGALPKHRDLSSIEVSGNSKSKMRTSAGMGGMKLGLTRTKEYTETAMDNAAEQIVEYIKAHKATTSTVQ